MEPTRENIEQALRSEESIELVLDLESVESADSNAVVVSVPVPSPELVQLRSTSLTTAFSSQLNSSDLAVESKNSEDVRKPLCTPGLVMSGVWMVAAGVCSGFEAFHISVSETIFSVTGASMMALSFVISIYWAFCIMRLSKGLDFKDARQKLLLPLLLFAVSLFFPPTFWAVIGAFLCSIVYSCAESYPLQNACYAFAWAIGLYILLPVTLSTMFFYWLLRKLQDRYCDASISLLKRRTTAALVVSCHFMPLLFMLVSGILLFLQYRVPHPETIELLAHIWTSAFLVALSVCQFLPFLVLKGWIYPQKRASVKQP